MAARDDGFLVTYHDYKGFHVRHLDANGALVNSTTIPPDTQSSHYDTLIAIAQGYAAIGRATYTLSTYYQLPRVIAFAPDGSQLQSPRWLDLPPTGHAANVPVAASRGDRWALAWSSEECCNSAFSSQLRFRSPCGPPFGETDPASNCQPDTSAAPIANAPFPGALFYTSAPGQPPSLHITLSKEGSSCTICGEELGMSIQSQLPICPPETIEWDVNTGRFGPEVGWCSTPNSPCTLALAGQIRFVAYDETRRVAGSYWFDFGGGHTLSGTLDAIRCEVPGGVTTCTAP